MRLIASIVFVLILSASVGIAQTDTTPVISTTPGDVQSSIPAATTGTAPIDSNTPSGTGTTGTSGTTMEQAAENNESNSSFVWVVVGALALAGLIFLLRKKRRRT